MRLMTAPWALTGVISLGLAAPLALAQQSAPLASVAAPAIEAGGLEEVVVTAQKRVERLQDVPLSMSVADSKQIANQHVTDITDLAKLTPALEVRQTGGTPGGGMQIRGIGTQAFTRTAEPAVGMVVDGVAQGDLNTSTIFDVQRIEVLRGPQGTLFGLSSSAGIVQLVTNAPDPSGFSASAHADYSDNGTAGSEFGQQTLHAVVNLPINADSALRIAASANRIQGVQYNAVAKKDYTSDHYGVRARYLWSSDRFKLNLIGDYDSQWEDSGTENAVISSFTYVTANASLANELASCGITAGFANKSRCQQHPAFESAHNYGFSAQMDWDIGSDTLTSISSYRGFLTGPNAQDVQALPGPYLASAPGGLGEFPQIYDDGGVTSGARQFNQELRIASPNDVPVQYTVGLYYNDYTAHSERPPGTHFALVFPGFIFGQAAPTVDIGLPAQDIPTATTNRAEAIFGQLTFHASDKLGVIAGGRFTHQKVTDFTSADVNQPYGGPEQTFFTINLGAPPVLNIALPALENTVNNFSGKVGVQYKFSENLNSYATITKGYKGPQAQSATPTSPVATLVPPEIPLSYEVGVKGTINDRFGVDANLFFTKDHNYQTQQCSLNFQGLLVCVPDSVDIDSKGVEIDFFGKLVRGLTVNGGVIYNVAELPSDFKGFDPNNLNGGLLPMGSYQIPYVPKFKVTAAADYTWNAGRFAPAVGVDVVYKSSLRLGASPDPRFVYSGPANVGAHLAIFSSDSHWGVTLFGRNLFQNREPALLFGGPPFVPPGVDPSNLNGYVKGISGWPTKNSEREIGLSLDFKL